MSTIVNTRYKFSHDMILEAIAGGPITSDFCLRSMYILGDDTDGQTPDILVKIKDFHEKPAWICVEFSSSESSEITYLESKYTRKVMAYSGGLTERSIKMNCSVVFLVVIVGWSHVLSSIELPSDIVDDLITRNRVTRSIKSLYSEKFSVPFDSDEKSKSREQSRILIRENIYKIKKDERSLGSPCIDSFFMSRCCSPADNKAMIELFNDSIIKSYKMLVDEVCNKEENDRSYINRYISSNKVGHRRKDRKCIVNLPGVVVPAKTELSTTVKPVAILCDKFATPEEKLWARAFDEVITNPQKFVEDPELLIQRSKDRNHYWGEELTTSRMKQKKEYHRVNLRGVLNEDELIQVAYDGLWGKKQKSNPSVTAQRIESQKPFDWNTDTSDIDEHINSKEFLDDAGPLKDMESSFRLVEEAYRYADNPPQYLKHAKDWLSTKLFHHYHFISVTALEVAIANKQNCQPHMGILKSPLGLDCNMLMIPTKSSEHFFISFYFGSKAYELFKGTGLKLIKIDTGYVTQFTSFKQSKLENKSSMDCSVLTLAAHWAFFYNLPDASPESFKNHEEARKMLLLSLLIRCEDKERTEFTITQTRYMYMECFKGSAGLVRPNPLRLLSKLEDRHRSRLSLWISKNIVKNFSEMSRNPPTRKPIIKEDQDKSDQETRPDDDWNGLINFFTGGTISSASRCINLSYLGYLKNKNETQEGNSDHKITSKIVGPEFQFKKNHPGVYGYPLGPKEQDQLHSFDLNAFLHGTGVMRNKLRNKLGPNYRSVIESEIIELLAKQTTEMVATLKASCSADQIKLSNQNAELSNEFKAGRIKVLEALAKEINAMSLNPFWGLAGFLNWFETNGLKITVDIFRKPQHGGVREIYVMTIRSRIMQLFLECIGRVICSYFPEETMTHPENKISRLDSHRVASVKHAKSRKCTYTDLGSSMDKSKWNQQILMTALYAVMSQFLPQDMLPALQRCLNLFVDRLVILPQSILNMLITGQVIQDEDFQKLYQHFLKPGKDRVFRRAYAPYITMMTGMMQGVLHFMSSVMHVCFLNSCESLIPTFIRENCPNCDVKFTQVCSSDDSSCILSIFSPVETSADDPDYNRAVFLAQLCLNAIPFLCKKYCMTNSPKSVICTPNIVEFNSEFLIYNTLAVPHIKYVAAQLLIAEASSCKKRMELFYGNMSELFRMGFPSYNTMICQVGQALMHYSVLGSSTNPVFEFYSKLLSKAPEAIYGFFTIDSIFFPGLAGLQFSQWYCAKRTGTLRRSKKDLISSDVEIGKDGGVTISLSMRMGDCRNWIKRLDDMRGSINIQDEIEKNAYLLFREARTVQELYIKFLMIASSPSVASSMSSGNPFIQGLASSVYAINTKCFTRVNLTKILGKLDKKIVKTSLVVELLDRIEEIKDAEEFSSEDIRLMYPSIDRYLELEEVIQEALTYDVVKAHRLRFIRTSYEIIPTCFQAVITLKQAVNYIWFHEGTSHTTQATERAINYYKTCFPWLNDTIKSTLSESPFSTYSELQGFIESHNIKTRRLYRIGPGSKSSNFKVKIMGLVRRSFMDGYLLGKRGETGGRIYRDKEYLTKINLAMNFPISHVRRKAVLDLLTDENHPPPDLTEFKNLGYRERKFAAIQTVALNKHSSDDILRAMSESGTGIIYKYREVQKESKDEKGKSVWTGKGSVTVTANNMVYIIEMIDNICHSITVRSLERAMKFPKTLNHIMNHMKLKPYPGFKIIEGNPCAKWNEKGISPTFDPGTPIFESERIIRDIGINSKLGIEVRQDRLVLIQRDPNRHKDLVILAHVSRSEDIHIQESLEETNVVIDAWVNQKRLSIDASYNLIKSYFRTNSMSTDYKKWLAETLLSRLYVKERLNQNIRRMTYDKEGEEKMEPEPANAYTEAEKILLVNDLYKRFQKMEEFTTVFSSIAKSSEINNENFSDVRTIAEFLMADYDEEDYTINSKLNTDFKRRMCFFDSFIEDPNKNATEFWARVFDGRVVTGYPRLSEHIMDMYGIEKTSTTTTNDNLLLTDSEKVERLGKVKTIILPPGREVNSSESDISETETEADESSAEEEEQESDDDVSDTEMERRVLEACAQHKLEERQRMFEFEIEKEIKANQSKAELKSQGAVPKEKKPDESKYKDKFKESKGRRTNLKLEAIKEVSVEQEESRSNNRIDLEREIEMSGLRTRASGLAKSGMRLITYMESILCYVNEDSCAEPEVYKKLESVKHDGDCFYWSIIKAMKLNISVLSLKQRLKSSPFFEVCMGDPHCADSLNNLEVQATDKIIKLTSREFKVNICLHVIFKDGESTYSIFKTDPNYRWVHLQHSNIEQGGSAMFEPLTVDWYEMHPNEVNLLLDLSERVRTNPDLFRNLYAQQDTLEMLEEYKRDLSEFYKTLRIKSENLLFRYEHSIKGKRDFLSETNYYRIEKFLDDMKSKISSDLLSVSVMILVFETNKEG